MVCKTFPSEVLRHVRHRCYNLRVMAYPTAAPESTPHSLNGEDAQKPSDSAKTDEVMYQTNLFYVTVLNMSWQLAIAVVVPIVGGYQLDQRLGSSPWLTLLGLAIAAAGTFVVMKFTLMKATKRAMHQPTKGNKN